MHEFFNLKWLSYEIFRNFGYDMLVHVKLRSKHWTLIILLDLLLNWLICLYVKILFDSNLVAERLDVPLTPVSKTWYGEIFFSL